MYLSLITRWFTQTWEHAFPKGFLRSRLAFLGGLAALVLIPSLLWYLHQHGKFHSAKQDLGVSNSPESPSVPRPGGAEPMVLTRKETIGTMTPELLSVTLLPGLGIGVLQVTASVPGHGVLPLLSAPTIEELADGTAGPRSGVADDHGSLQAPWGGLIAGVIAPLGTTLQTAWYGRTFSVSRNPSERNGIAEGGMLMSLPADAVQMKQLGDGAQGEAEFHATNFNDHWPSRTDVKISSVLGSRTLDLTIIATNTGTEAEPMGLGWFPRFTFPAADRQKLDVRLPYGDVMEMNDRVHGLPTGRFLPAPEGVTRYQGRSALLGTAAKDLVLGHLKPALLDSGAAVELRDTNGGFGLRISAVSPSIRALHLVSPEGAGYIGVGLQTNYDDAFGKEWNGDGIATLAPGQSLEWKIRLEIFPLTPH